MKRYIIYILCMVMGLPMLAESSSTRIDKNLTIYTDVMRQLDINYVDTLNYEKLIKTSINAMLRQVDPYTVYMPKSEDDNLRMMTTGKYGGKSNSKKEAHRRCTIGGNVQQKLQIHQYKYPVGSVKQYIA